MKTASTNSPWAYIREGLLSEGYLCLIFGGLFSGGLIFGGAYYQNFTVLTNIGFFSAQGVHLMWVGGRGRVRWLTFQASSTHT